MSEQTHSMKQTPEQITWIIKALLEMATKLDRQGLTKARDGYLAEAIGFASR